MPRRLTPASERWVVNQGLNRPPDHIVVGCAEMVLSNPSSGQESQCHRIKYVHSIIFAHPRAALGRETRTEFIGKSFGDTFSQSVFGSLTVSKKRPPYLSPRK